MGLVFSEGYDNIFSLPQHPETKNKIKSRPGKKSQSDFNNWEMNLRILRPKPGEDLVMS
jgi:ABC-type oligopeptide transport system ATPase subunit